MADKSTLTIPLDRRVKERLDAIASSTKRDSQVLAAEAIEEFVAVQEWQIAGIEKAIRSMHAGSSIPHREVAAWIESWGNEDEAPVPEPKRA